MKKIYVLIILVFASWMPVFKVSAQDMSYAKVKGPIPKGGITDKVMNNYTSVYLNYMESDSLYYPLSYFTNYMFYMNSRYAIQDTGFPRMTNELLLQSFSVMFDTIIDANYIDVNNVDTGYASSIVQSIIIDSFHIIIGHEDASGKQDTIVVQIDSIDAFTGYITSTVLHTDTIYPPLTGLSPGNNWLNPVNLAIKLDYPFGYLINGNKFGVSVFFYGNKSDTLGFLPGFPYNNCKAGGSGAIPTGTKIGDKFGGLRANSLTSGYKYFFDSTRTIPTSVGATDGLYVQCSKPASTYWYFQDNPISAYITFKNTTGINELEAKGFSISQNYPQPFQSGNRDYL